MNKNLNIILSGGGTGGHIYPAVSIAKAISQLHQNCNILFVGANGKMEMEKVPAAGFKIKGIDIIGFQRKLSIKNLFIPYYLYMSISQVRKIFSEFKPNIVIGTGGYVSFPVLLTAQLRNIPTYIQEQNALPGLANKILSKKAKKIFVAYDNMDLYFPKEKIIVSGNPVRTDLLHLENKKKQAIHHFQLHNNSPIVLVLGGSLGAKTINEAIAQNIDFFMENNVQLIWQMGKNYFKNINQSLSNKLSQYSIYYKDFIYEMDFAYAAADIIISRAGASTLAELSIVGKPAILIPSPNVTNDHQTKNALAFIKKDAAIMIKDTDAIQELPTQLRQILNNHTLQQKLSENIQKLAKPNSTDIIAQNILVDILN